MRDLGSDGSVYNQAEDGIRDYDVSGVQTCALPSYPPLARALYAAVEIDEAIPPAHFEAVAKIIGFILGARAPSTARARPMR